MACKDIHLKALRNKYTCTHKSKAAATTNANYRR